ELWPALEPLWVRPGAHDGDVGRRLRAPGDGDLPVRVVRGDHLVRRPVRPAFQGQQRLMRQRRAVREARFEQLRAQIVMVEHEAGAVYGAKDPGDRPEDVGRVARLEHLEPAGAPPCLGGQPGRGREGVRVLRDVAALAPAGGYPPFLVPSPPARALGGGAPASLRPPPGALTPGGAARWPREPAPPVERHREVLDDDQYPAHRPDPSK